MNSNNILVNRKEYNDIKLGEDGIENKGPSPNIKLNRCRKIAKAGL